MRAAFYSFLLHLANHAFWLLTNVVLVMPPVYAWLPVEKINAWAAEVEAFLTANLDPSYVARFRNGSGLDSRILVGANISLERQGYWWAVHTRTVRLDQFVTELSR